jgi:cell division protease FtsH
VTKQAYAMVSIFGMSDKVGNVSYYDSSGQSEFAFSKPYSEKTAELIDAESKQLIEFQYTRAKEVLQKNKEGHQKLAELLLEKEVIFSEDLENIFGKRPWAKPALVNDVKKENGSEPSEKTDTPTNEHVGF